MEAFDNDLNSYLAGCETKVCSVCGYVGEVSEFSPECPVCGDIDDGDEEDDLFEASSGIFKP